MSTNPQDPSDIVDDLMLAAIEAVRIHTANYLERGTQFLREALGISDNNNNITPPNPADRSREVIQ